jgi:hypothetical protein
MPAPLRGVVVGHVATTGLLVGGASLISSFLNQPVLQFTALTTAIFRHQRLALRAPVSR